MTTSESQMSAIVNMTPSQPDLLGGILERLNGTVTQVSQLRQSLGNLEIELVEIRNQCETARAAAAAAATKAHDGNTTTIIRKAHPEARDPVPLQRPELDRDQIRPRREQKRIDRHTESPRSERKDNSKSNPVAMITDPKSHSTPLSPFPGVSSSSRIPEGSGSLAGLVVKAGNSLEVSCHPFRTRPAQPQVQVVAAPGPMRKFTKKLPMPIQIALPPLSPFPEDIKLSSYPPGLKHEGDDWFVLYNPSPKVKWVLDVNVVHTLKHNNTVTCVKFSRDGKWLATGCLQTAQIYDVKTGIKTHNFAHEDNERLWSVAFSPDGKYFATGGHNKQVTVWDVPNQQIHDILKGHQQTVYSLDFSPNGQFIVSGSRDGTVRIWDLHNRTFKLLTIGSHYLSPDHEVWSVAISPDGGYVAVGSEDTVVSIWEITTGVLVQTLRGHTDGVQSVMFMPDGKGLISGSDDATLKYWDVVQLGNWSGASTSIASSSPCLMNLTGHKNAVYSTAVSHDGTWVVSGSGDRSVLFWDTRTGVAQCLLSGHTHFVYGVDMSPIGNFLATTSVDQQVRIWTYR